MAALHALKGLDSKAFCTACFVIDASPAQWGGVFDGNGKGFFTKLSTEFVHQWGLKPAPARNRKALAGRP